jgi:hypothetical protein
MQPTDGGGGAADEIGADEEGLTNMQMLWGPQ